MEENDLEAIVATQVVTVMVKAEYKLYVSGDGSPRLTWIYGL